MGVYKFCLVPSQCDQYTVLKVVPLSDFTHIQLQQVIVVTYQLTVHLGVVVAEVVEEEQATNEAEASLMPCVTLDHHKALERRRLKLNSTQSHYPYRVAWLEGSWYNQTHLTLRLTTLTHQRLRRCRLN